MLVVSALMIIYNHEGFIREAIEGVLMQECDFEAELIIANDCSLDNTDAVIQDILQNHPKSSWIKYFKHDKNLGMMPNFIFALQQAKGKYIALCEGDDYWTDPLKLEKQVGFLEANPEYGICFHNVMQLNTFDISKNTIIPNIDSETDYVLEDYIINNKTATCSIVFKKEYLNSMPSWFLKVPFGDLALILYVMYNSNKRGHILKEDMGVYRIHDGGIHGSFHKNNKSLITAYLQHIQFNKIISKEFLVDKKYRKPIFQKFLNTYIILANLYLKEKDKLNWIKAKCFMKYYMFKLKLNS